MKTFTGFLLSLLLLSASVRAQEIKALQRELPGVKDSLHYCDLLNRLSILFYEINVDSCLGYARQAFDISVRRQYPKGKADALNNMGIVYDLSDNPPLAFRYYNEALDIYEILHDTSNIIQLKMNIGLVMEEKGELAKSSQYFRDAIHQGKTLRKDSIMALVLTDYVTIFIDSISMNLATTYVKRASQIAFRYNDQRVLLASEQVQGLIDLKLGKEAEGIAALKKAAAGAIALNDNYLVLDMLDAVGDHYLPTLPDSALKYYKQALGIADAKAYHTYSKLLAQKLYDYYFAKRDEFHAQLYASQLLTIYHDEETANNISGVDYIDYAVAQKELETTRTRSENRDLVILILSIFLLSTVSIGVFIFQLYRLKRKHAITLEALNEVVNGRNEQLQKKHEFNNKLVSLLAHDFRQPINTARNLSLLLKNHDSISEEELQNIIRSIESSSDTAIEIFENILQWIKRQLSGFRYEPASLSLNDMVLEAILPYADAAAQHKITVVNTVVEDAVIRADKELLQFVNRNLIHNALKFSPEGGTIIISANATEKEVIVCIRDEGKGIHPDKLSQIFNFQKEFRYDNEKEKGAGVALMICKDFIDRMYGRIWVENGVDKGAIFCYALPIGKQFAVGQQAANFE